MTSKIKNVTVVGVGALGSHLVLFGRNLNVGWTVIDDDRIEQKNVASQFHTRQGLGRNKAQALSQAMKGLFGKNIKAITHRLTADNAGPFLGGTDLVIDCLDNGESRRIVQNIVRELGTPCLHGALAPDGQLGRVVWDEEFTIDDEDVPGQATCEGGEFLPLIVETSAVMVRCMEQFIKEGKKIGMQVQPNYKLVL